jgi:2-polyprenyl-6-methoxyphenol hydroxylase-like FAD-dependent oxidoreductase
MSREKGVTDGLDCQVLVVGAGPTGLVLAAELLRRGITTRIVDKGDGQALQSRALALHSRTLEVLDMMGIVERFLERGQTIRRFRMYTGPRPLLTLDLSRCGSRYGFMLNIPQDESERLLREHVSDLGGRIEQSTELLALRETERGVEATLKTADRRLETVTAAYLAGCDGSHSQVRKQLGLEFAGHPYDDDWLLADAVLDWEKPADEVHAFFNPRRGPVIFFPMRDGRWRVFVPFAGDRGRHAPSLEDMQHLVDERCPLPVRLSDPTWLAAFRCQLRSTHAYRRGRVVLAGDAVHVHSPAGGQGMNTGMMDAHNLGWKLALVASAKAPETLLDTYGEERAPVARQVLALTDGIVRLGMVRQPVKLAVRDMLVPLASRLPALQRRAARRMTQQHVSYRAGCLSRSRESWHGLRAGDRMPDVAVGGSRLFELLRAGEHVRLTSPGSATVLVRPDGYIGAIGDASIDAYLVALSGGASDRPATAAAAMAT